MTTPKTEAMQKIVTQMKGHIAQFGDARELDNDAAADAVFGVILEDIESLINQTVADIPPKVEIKEVVVPGPSQAPDERMKMPQAAPAGLQKYLPKFLK